MKLLYIVKLYTVMPKGRSYKKRGQKKSTSWYDQKYSPMDIAQKAWKGVKLIKSLINVEKKMYDTLSSGVITDTPGSLILMTPIPIGDTYNTRDGNSIKLTSNYFVMRVFNNPAASFSNVRYMLVQDTGYNATALTTAQILENVAGAGTSLVSPLEHTIGSRLNILYDKYIQLSGTGKQSEIVEHYTTLDNHIKFDDANVTSTTLREGHLYILLISDVGSNYPGYTLYNRTRFTDN